jgi:hypothetical protein
MICPFSEELIGQLFAEDFGAAWLFLDFNSFGITGPGELKS